MRCVCGSEASQSCASATICANVLRGKVRLRTKSLGEKCEWRDYQAARLSGVDYGATFRRKEELTAWINSQVLTNPLTCLGDGHSGVWNLFSRIANTQQRHEILDWFHLKKNWYIC